MNDAPSLSMVPVTEAAPNGNIRVTSIVTPTSAACLDGITPQAQDWLATLPADVAAAWLKKTRAWERWTAVAATFKQLCEPEAHAVEEAQRRLKEAEQLAWEICGGPALSDEHNVLLDEYNAIQNAHDEAETVRKKLASMAAGAA